MCWGCDGSSCKDELRDVWGGHLESQVAQVSFSFGRNINIINVCKQGRNMSPVLASVSFRCPLPTSGNLLTWASSAHLVSWSASPATLCLLGCMLLGCMDAPWTNSQTLAVLKPMGARLRLTWHNLTYQQFALDLYYTCIIRLQHARSSRNGPPSSNCRRRRIWWGHGSKEGFCELSSIRSSVEILCHWGLLPFLNLR